MGTKNKVFYYHFYLNPTMPRGFRRIRAQLKKGKIMGTLDEIAEQVKKLDKLMEDFKKVSKTLISEGLSLIDICYYEEQARNITDEMVSTLQEIVTLRQWYEMEHNENGPF